MSDATKQPRQWFGTVPTICNCCANTIRDAFSDFRAHNGRWYLGCDACVAEYSCHPTEPYGMGKGQRYRRATYNGKTVWQKSAG